VGYGRVVHSQTKEVVCNVYTFVKQEADNGEVTDSNQVRNVVFKATGISRSSRHKVLEEEKIQNTDLRSETGPSFSSPVKSVTNPVP
jgi:hypothetical protein